MSGIERKLIGQTVLLGAVLTAAVLGAQLAGWLRPVEQWLYHVRARLFQFYTPPPTDQLVHLDIDERTLDAVGRWPWHRSDLADILDEIDRAEARTIAMDVALFEPSEPRYEVGEDGSAGRRIDDDARLAETLERSGRMLVPLGLSLVPERPPADLELEAGRILRDDLELTEEGVGRRLRQRGLEPERAGAEMPDIFIRARRRAMFERIDAAFEEAGRVLSPEELIPRLLPGEDPRVNTPLKRLLRRQHRRAAALHALRRFTKPADDPGPGAPPPQTPDQNIRGQALLPAVGDQPPLVAFARAAAASGYVDYLPYSDGMVRGVPLWVEYRGRLYPQLALAMACLHLGVDVRDVRIERDRILIPRLDGPPIPVPTYRHHVDAYGRSYGLFMDVPWFGGDDWQVMYDFPSYERQRRHHPLTDVWEIVLAGRRVERNNRQIDLAIRRMYALIDPSREEQYARNPPPLDQTRPRFQAVDEVLREAERAGWLDAFDMTEEAFADYLRSLPDELERENTRLFVASAEALPLLKRETEALVEQIDHARGQLRHRLRGRAVLIGWTAGGTVADFVPTSLHAQCPGVVVHGAIFNGIMTGHLWRHAPAAVGPLVTVLLGLVTTLVVAALSPIRSAVAAAVIAAGWAVFNGLVLFDLGDLVIGAAAPLLAISAVWAAGTVWRWVAERAERARITSRFRSYVDPALVDYVIEHPERSQFDGEVRELTVVFTDLAGFTSITERLGERTVGLLNRYLGLMVPIIREHHGYVNKFIGDGVMFFYGAPAANTYHAADAVGTVLKMQRRLGPFNDGLERDGFPRVQARAGVATGPMVVGDAGPPDASDYTVLGDTVNLASRLEAANKAVGTSILINQRAMELLGDLFLLRPIANLQVKGKTAGVMTYEPLAYREEATDEQRKLAEMTRRMVRAYIDAAFDRCIDAAEKIEEAVGPSKLTTMYREMARRQLVEPEAQFAGQVVLSEK